MDGGPFANVPRATLIRWLLVSFGKIALWLAMTAALVTVAAAWWAIDQAVVK